ncbi:hypothetical protein [Parvibaculum sp.]|uniref:hypothetical protein n=1 Tax=Parvibaculum sp. TaxID=2024848 RepID=UPI001DF41138|nr:hypothetical protein [Parvibaculum sp.]MBX3490900.1 hypothetical protein [Parvibaculum sp.]
MADVEFPAHVAGVTEKFVDMGDGTHARAVAVVGVDGDVILSGDVVVDTLGALDDSAEDNPDAASATIPALLRGILAEMKAQTALLTTIAENTDLGGG